MSSKLYKIPHFNSYDDIRAEMQNDLQYRLANRADKTSLGRPLYYRINVQLILTQECPYNCPFCLERKNPMQGDNNFKAQIESLKKILLEHPNARLTITGGEPGLYPNHVSELIDTYKKHSNNVFCSINTTGYSNREKLRTVSRQDMTVEYQTCGQMETWLLKDMGETAEKQIDVAVTLRARDYKGLDNYGSNGVIEWKN